MNAPADDRPLVAALVGRPGLAREVFGRILQDQGIIVVGTDTGTAVDVVVIVEPLSEQWSDLRHCGIPMVLVLGDEAGDGVALEAAGAGANAVLSFSASPAEVRLVLHAVGRGGSVMAPRPVVLSRREAEILASIADGHAAKQTAQALGISRRTVENLQGRLFRKLTVRNRAQAVARAHSLGLL